MTPSLQALCCAVGGTSRVSATALHPDADIHSGPVHLTAPVFQPVMWDVLVDACRQCCCTSCTTQASRPCCLPGAGLKYTHAVCCMYLEPYMGNLAAYTGPQCHRMAPCCSLEEDFTIPYQLPGQLLQMSVSCVASYIRMIDCVDLRRRALLVSCRPQRLPQPDCVSTG